MGAQTAEARAAQVADLIACRIRWECRGLKGRPRQDMGRDLLAAVPEAMRPAVIEALKGRAGNER